MDEETLVARLSIIDDISETLSHIADVGADMSSRLSDAGTTASSAFEDATSSANSMASAMDSLDKAASGAATGMSYWTQAANNYDKSALEAIHSTEELVDMGLKSADALLEESHAAEAYDQTMEALYHEMENVIESHDTLADAIDRANDVSERAAQSDEVSAEAKLRLNQANQEATEAFEELEKAQAQAQAAMDEFDRAASAEVLNTKDLAEAANHAAEANDTLAEAQKRADKASANLTKATERASKGLKDFSEEAEEDSKTILGALEQIAETVAFAKIIQYCKMAMGAVYELADAFSEAQKVVVNATGATDEALAGLEASMMNAFSTHHADLNATAGAIGEINTRMQLTGDTLTEVTGDFLDFSTITGSNVVGAVQNVTKVMNKWKIEQTDVVSVLDKLAYAGQISGASVDSLASSLITGAPSFQAMNLSIDTAISLLAAFELQGINSGTAIMALRTAARKFANDNVDASKALQETIEKISTLKSESEATSLAIKTFGSRAGLEMVTAIRNGAISVEMLNSDLKVAEGTLQKTAEAGETLGEKWDTSSNKFKTAFTSAVQPTLDKWSSGFAKVVGSIGDFLAEHETLTKVLVSAGTTIGLIAAGISGLTIVINTVIPAIRAFGATIATVATAHPVLAVITALGAVAVGITTLMATMDDAEKEVADYDGTLEECANEIENTKRAHEAAIEAYGAESDAAKQLGQQLNTLNAQYQKGGGFAEDYAQRTAESVKAFNDFKKDYDTKMGDIEKTATSGRVVAIQLQTLSEKAHKTNADLNLMGKYADYLNNEFNCNIKVNYKTGELTGFKPAEQFIKDFEKITGQQTAELALNKLADPDFKAEYISDISKIKALEAETQRYQSILEKDLAGIYSPNGLSIKEVKEKLSREYPSSNPNEKYDFTKYYDARYGKDAGAGVYMGKPLEWLDRGFAWLFGDTLYAASPKEYEASDKFETDYIKYKQNVDNLNTLKAGLESKDSMITGLHKNAGMAGGETAYIADLKKAAVDSGNAVHSLTDFVKIYQGGLKDANGAQMSFAGAQYDIEKALDASKEAIDENTNALSTAWTSAMKDGELSVEDLTSLMNELPDEARNAVTNYTDQLSTIQTEYNKVYEACKQSFEGQFGLFDKAQENTDKTIWKLQEAQTSQLEYWEEYDTNISYLASLTAEKLGLTKKEFDDFKLGLDDLKQKAASGDEEIAGLLGNIKWHIENGDKDAVADIVTMQGKLKTERDKAAEDTATWVDDLDQKMNKAFENAQKSVMNMNSVAPEARAIALNIMKFYEEGIDAGGQKAINKAIDIANRVKNALSVSASVTVGPPAYNKALGIEQDAGGTTNSADVFIAGENGPELIVGKQHSTVFPTSETSKIVDAVAGLGRTAEMGSIESVFIPVLGKTVELASDMASFMNRSSDISLPGRAVSIMKASDDSDNSRKEISSDKKITIELAGHGNIEVSGDVSRESMLEVLQENLKPVLMNIISEEIYEEGDDSYEY